MVRLNWTKYAINDLNNIGKYISQDSMLYANRQILKIRTRAKILLKHPKAGNVVDEYGDEKVRELVQGNYRIIYEIVSESQVDVLTIHHTARNLKNRRIK
jgi:toxin ParE1/3/4